MAFVNTLMEMAKKNNRIILLTGDLGFQIFDDFRNRFGPRYVNVGVAEAQMVCAAGGLAYVGWRPITYAIAPFMTARCFEQIKISVAYPHLPVLIVGVGGGYAYASDGVTHHAADDLNLMSSLPGMTVLVPGDAGEVEQLLPQVLDLDGPCYLRLGRGNEPKFQVKTPVILGRARLLQEGHDIAILSTGDVVHEVMEALKILHSRNIFPIVYQFHTLKPMDTAVLGDLAKKVRMIVTVEEHIPSGGLGCSVREWLSAQENAPCLISLSGPDEFVLGSPKQHEIRSKYKFDAKAIVEAITRNENITK